MNYLQIFAGLPTTNGDKILFVALLLCMALGFFILFLMCLILPPLILRSLIRNKQAKNRTVKLVFASLFLAVGWYICASMIWAFAAYYIH